MATVSVYVTNYTDTGLGYDAEQTNIEEGDFSTQPVPNIAGNATSPVLAFTAYHKHSKNVKGAVAYGGLDNNGLIRIKYGTVDPYPDTFCTTFVELMCNDELTGKYGYDSAVVVDNSATDETDDDDFKIYIDVYPAQPTSYPSIQSDTSGDTCVVINNQSGAWLTLQSSDGETYKTPLATTGATTCIPPNTSLCINNYSKTNKSEPTLTYNLTDAYGLILELQGDNAPKTSWILGQAGDYHAGHPEKSGNTYTIDLTYTGP